MGRSADRAGRRRYRLGPRAIVQGAALALVLVGVFVVRGHAERWCPFGGVETAWAYFTEGNALCSVGVANLFVAAALLASLLLLRRAFCSHACPIGTVSEWVRAGARRLGVRGRRVPPALDRLLSLLKYAVLALVVWVTWRAGELLFRSACPAYALIGRHGADITAWAYVTAGVVVLGSVVTDLPFCRWLCPLAAVMNPLSRLGVARIARDADVCTGCGKCARACPMAIPVAAVQTVVHARCTLCLACVDACPARGRRTIVLTARGRPRRAVSAGVLAVALVAFLGAGAAAAALWPLPSFQWARGTLPTAGAVLDVRVGDLTCRGRANLLAWFLDRDDDLAVEGPLRLEAWPAPGEGRARIRYDPELTTPAAIRAALGEPCHDESTGRFRASPFRVEGYDPLGLEPAGR